MARHRTGGGGRTRPETPLTQAGPTQAKVREVVTAIAAEVIAETAERLAGTPRPKAAALRIEGGRRAARRRG